MEDKKLKEFIKKERICGLCGCANIHINKTFCDSHSIKDVINQL